MSATANVTAKAERLIDEGRMYPAFVEAGRLWVGIADGDTARYLVVSVDRGTLPAVGAAAGSTSCECDAFRKFGRTCAHITAAELLRDRTAVEAAAAQDVLIAGLFARTEA